MKEIRIAIIMGSKRDFEIVKPAVDMLKSFGLKSEVRVMSAHRSPDLASAFAKNAEKNGIEVIIAAAGKSAHLAGVIAGITILPVIGLPIQTSFMGGLDSLLSIVQMPAGIPVATVGVNAPENAALLAVQMLSLKYPELKTKLNDYKQNMAKNIEEDDKAIQGLII